MTTVAKEKGLQWLEDVDQGLAESKKSGKAALLDFTAAPA